MLLLTFVKNCNWCLRVSFEEYFWYVDHSIQTQLQRVHKSLTVPHPLTVPIEFQSEVIWERFWSFYCRSLCHYWFHLQPRASLTNCDTRIWTIQDTSWTRMGRKFDCPCWLATNPLPIESPIEKSVLPVQPTPTPVRTGSSDQPVSTSSRLPRGLFPWASDFWTSAVQTTLDNTLITSCGTEYGVMTKTAGNICTEAASVFPSRLSPVRI